MKNFNNIIKRIFRESLIWLPDKLWLKLKFRHTMGYTLNLKNPKTFQEKIQWLKLYDRKPEYTLMVDKFAVKDYVAGIIGTKYIIPTLGVWNSPDDIDLFNLPDKFVLKTTQGGGSNGVIICRDKSKFDINDAKHKLKSALKFDIYKHYREWPYKNVKKNIIAEKFIDDNSNSDLTDYKFFCFHGEPIYCQVIADRSINETIDFYDVHWNHMPFVGLAPVKSAEKRHKKPLVYDKMIELARKLSKNTKFLRVDLYNIEGQIYFGELTFYPNSGFGSFKPAEWDVKMGELINIIDYSSRT